MTLRQLSQGTERVILYTLAVLAFLAIIPSFGTITGIILVPLFALIGVGLLVLAVRVGHRHTPTAK